MDNPVYRLHMPAERRSCAVFNSPHSGADYPQEFLDQTRLGPVRIRSSEDAFVDELYAAAPEYGAPLMAARVPRACVDLNRSADDLDPALIAGAPRRFLNPRIAAGLGVIPRVVAEGAPIREGKLQLAEATRRLATYWHPYHDTLRALLVQSRELYGMAILFDCHSMPHDALASAPDVWGRRPQVILGDRFGTACGRWLTDATAEIFADSGFAVARNVPFAGGYITQAYGRPKQGMHVLQIEIDRSLYMDESRIARSPAYPEVAARLRHVVASLSDLGVRPLQVAAE
jgi:N-formylglutamate amidohydrolase